MPGTFDKLTGTEKSAQNPVDEESMHVAPLDDVDVKSSLESSTNHKATCNTRSPSHIREVAKELTRYGFIEASRKPNLYRTLQNNHSALAAILEPLDLNLVIDDVRGLALVTLLNSDVDDVHRDNAEHDPDAWSHPLVRRQRLTLEQSLLVAILRQHFVAYEQEAGVGADGARVAVDELVPEFQIYLGDSGSEARERTRMLTLLDQLKGHGLVSEPDGHERVTIRPIIAHVANPENLQYMLEWLQRRQSGSPPVDQAEHQEMVSASVVNEDDA